MPAFTRDTPLPALWYYLFAVIEPTLSLIGAVYAVGFPKAYLDSAIHYADVHLIGDAGGGPRGVMVTRELGSCFLLFTVFSYCIYPTLTTNLHGQPVVHENILLAILLCLAIGDIAHVGATLASLPPTILHYPFEKWTSLIWGNILMPSALFFARSLWFLGVGRPTYGLRKEQVQPPRSKGYARVPTAEVKRD